MTSHVATAEPGLGVPPRGLIEALFGLFSIEAAAEASEPTPDPEVVALLEQVRLIGRNAIDAPNGRVLRQALAEAGLSAEWMRLNVAHAPALLQVESLDLAKPVRIPRTLAGRLGSALPLVEEALALFSVVLRWRAKPQPALGGRSAAEVDYTAVAALGPERIAAYLQQAVLGDVFPAKIAEVVLAHARGQVAFALLPAMVTETIQWPEWKMVQLGELALEGMKALHRLALPSPDRIDLDAIAVQYRAQKADAFARLDADEDDTPSLP